MTIELKIGSKDDRASMAAILVENGYAVASEERDVKGYYPRTTRVLIVEIPEEGAP